ncbi:MAG: hypothetical protein ACP5GB_01815 [Candidatus Micrarchaeia archaeon]
MNANALKVMYYLFFATALISIVNGATSSNSITAVSSAFCALVNTVRSIIALFAVVMFLIGGVLYAIGHFLPNAGQLKGSVQGWAIGMILGGIVGVVLVIIAQPIVNMVAKFGSGISSVSC